MAGLQVWNIAELRAQIARFYKLRWCKNRPDKFIRTFGIAQLREHAEHTGTFYTWKTLLACDPSEHTFEWVRYNIYSMYGTGEEADAHYFEYELAMEEQQLGTRKYHYKDGIFESSDDSSSESSDEQSSSSSDSEESSDTPVFNKIRAFIRNKSYRDNLIYYAVIHRLKRLLYVINRKEDKSSDIRRRFEKHKEMNEHVRAKADINVWIYQRRFDDVYCCPIEGSTMLWFINNDMTKHVHRKYKFKLHSYECDYTPLSYRMTELLAKNSFFKEDYQSQIRHAITRLYPSLFRWLVVNCHIGDMSRVFDLSGYGYKNVKTLLKHVSWNVEIYHRSTLDEIGFPKLNKLLSLGLKFNYQLRDVIRKDEPFKSTPHWKLIDIFLASHPYASYEIVDHVKEHIKRQQTSCRVCSTISNEQLYDMLRNIIESTLSINILETLQLNPSLRMWWLAVEKQNVEVMWYCWSQLCPGLPGNNDVLSMMEYAYSNTGYRFVKPFSNPKNMTEANLKLLRDRYPGAFFVAEHQN